METKDVKKFVEKCLVLINRNLHIPISLISIEEQTTPRTKKYWSIVLQYPKGKQSFFPDEDQLTDKWVAWGLSYIGPYIGGKRQAYIESLPDDEIILICHAAWFYGIGKEYHLF